MMIGSETTRTAARGDKPRGEPQLHIDGIHALDDIGLKALEDLNLKVHAGEIVGIAGVSGNGQSKLVEVLAGQRKADRRAASTSTASRTPPPAPRSASTRSTACPRSR